MENVGKFLNKIILILIGMLVFVNIFSIDYVSGDSMDPTLKNGDYVLTTNIGKIKDNDIVIVDTSKNNKFDSQKIIKRYVANKSTDNEVWVEGDNASVSYDSRFTGPVKRTDVESHMVLNISGLFR